MRIKNYIGKIIEYVGKEINSIFLGYKVKKTKARIVRGLIDTQVNPQNLTLTDLLQPLKRNKIGRLEFLESVRALDMEGVLNRIEHSKLKYSFDPYMARELGYFQRL